MRFVALVPVIVSAAACSRDIFDVDIALASQAYAADYGAPPAGTVPLVACGPAMPAACGTAQAVDVASSTTSVPAGVSVVVACDDAKSSCYAQANASVGYVVDVLTDDAFITKVGRKAITFVRLLDLAYTLPRNTLTFDVPRVDVFVGPAGARAPTDAGVVLAGSVPPIAAGTTFGERRHLTVADGSPARALLESTIAAKQAFVLLVAAAPRVEAGAPMPGGAFELNLFPKVRVGLPP